MTKKIIDRAMLVRASNSDLVGEPSEPPALTIDSGSVAITRWLEWNDPDGEYDGLDDDQAWNALALVWEDDGWDRAGLAPYQRVRLDITNPAEADFRNGLYDALRCDGRIGYIVGIAIADAYGPSYVDVLVPDARECFEPDDALPAHCIQHQTPGSTVVLHAISALHCAEPRTTAMSGVDGQ